MALFLCRDCPYVKCPDKEILLYLLRLSLQAAKKYGYWVPDMSVECLTGWHLRLALGLGVPLLVVCCFGMPLLPVCLLLRHRKELQTASTQLQLGFLYKPYRQAASLPLVILREQCMLVSLLDISSLPLCGACDQPCWSWLKHLTLLSLFLGIHFFFQ